MNFKAAFSFVCSRQSTVTYTFLMILQPTYRLLANTASIDSGAYSSVMFAEHISSGKRVAIKRIDRFFEKEDRTFFITKRIFREVSTKKKSH